MLQYFRQDQVKNKDPKLFPFITGCKNLFIYYLFLNVSIINVAIVYKPTVSVWVRNNMDKPRVFIRNITKHQRCSENGQNHYRDNARQTQNCQYRIVMIPWRYWYCIGDDTWCIADTKPDPCDVHIKWLVLQNCSKGWEKKILSLNRVVP